MHCLRVHQRVIVKIADVLDEYQISALHKVVHGEREGHQRLGQLFATE